MKRLWYKAPATRFEEALPIGNGRLGGMHYAGISSDKISLNEDTLWSGFPRDKSATAPYESVCKARELMAENMLSVLSNDQINVIFLSVIIYIARLVLMFVSGFIANRCYYKHVVKKVQLAKEKYSSEDEVKKHLSETGGVNMILGYILLMAYFVVKCIPLLF